MCIKACSYAIYKAKGNLQIVKLQFVASNIHNPTASLFLCFSSGNIKGAPTIGVQFKNRSSIKRGHKSAPICRIGPGVPPRKSVTVVHYSVAACYPTNLLAWCGELVAATALRSMLHFHLNPDQTNIFI